MRCGKAWLRRRPDASRLRPVADPARPRLARFPFLLVMIGIFGLGMVGLLMLNTTLQNQAFEARALNRQATELAYVQADLEQRLDAYAAPRAGPAASKLGMRPNPHPAFLVLPEGRVVGEPKPVNGNEQQVLVVKTPEQIAPRRRRGPPRPRPPRRRRRRRNAPQPRRRSRPRRSERRRSSESRPRRSRAR